MQTFPHQLLLNFYGSNTSLTTFELRNCKRWQRVVSKLICRVARDQLDSFCFFNWGLIVSRYDLWRNKYQLWFSTSLDYAASHSWAQGNSSYVGEQDWQKAVTDEKDTPTPKRPIYLTAPTHACSTSISSKLSSSEHRRSISGQVRCK